MAATFSDERKDQTHQPPSNTAASHSFADGNRPDPAESHRLQKRVRFIDERYVDETDDLTTCHGNEHPRVVPADRRGPMLEIPIR